MQIKAFEKIIPVCCVCRKIREDTNKEHGSGEWIFADEYIGRHSDLYASHTYCDECSDVAEKEIKEALARRNDKKDKSS